MLTRACHTIALTALLVLPVAAPAFAAPAIDAAGAAALKPRLSDALGAIREALGRAGMEMKIAGDLMVEPAGSYYAITTPNVTLSLPNGATRTVGMVAINAIPTDNPDVFKVAIALPTPMVDTNSAGASLGSLSIGQQTMNGLWSMKAVAFTEMTASYKNIRITGPNNSEKTIPALDASLKLSPRGDLWGGPFNITLTDYVARDAKTRTSIGRLQVQGEVDKFNLTAQKGGAQVTGVNSALGSWLGSTIGALGLTATATNVEIQSPKTLTVQNVEAKTNITNITGGAGDATFSLRLSAASSPEASMAQYLPAQTQASGTATKFPVEAALTAMDFSEFKAALAKAGTTLTFNTLQTEAQAYGINGKGTLTAAPSAPLGMTGQMNLTTRGLPELTSWLASPDGAPSVGITVPANVVAGMALIQLTGTPGADTGGRPTLAYDLNMTSTKTLLNGADLTPMLQGIKK